MDVSISTWQTLQQAADSSRRSAAHEQAIHLYTEALAQPDVPWTAACLMRIERSHSWFAVGDFAAIDHDLTALAAQAAGAGDDAALVTALVELVTNLRMQGDSARCQLYVQQALAAAARTGRADLKIDSLYVLGIAQIDRADLPAAQASLAAAEALWTADNVLGRIKTLFGKGYLMLRMANHQEAVRSAEEALQAARAGGWRA